MGVLLILHLQKLSPGSLSSPSSSTLVQLVEREKSYQYPGFPLITFLLCARSTRYKLYIVQEFQESLELLGPVEKTRLSAQSISSQLTKLFSQRLVEEESKEDILGNRFYQHQQVLLAYSLHTTLEKCWRSTGSLHSIDTDQPRGFIWKTVRRAKLSLLIHSIPLRFYLRI